MVIFLLLFALVPGQQQHSGIIIGYSLRKYSSVLMGPHGMLRVKPLLAKYKTSTLLNYYCSTPLHSYCLGGHLVINSMQFIIISFMYLNVLVLNLRYIDTPIQEF